ncbi:hypothetical protein [Sulfuricystis multivorans]|uniref:hypothetical protein n=1 Tax=Sulfuricystis multivorans TaxID=2211108 RepID=UPI000F82E2A0|nr:hypothetical protein [Sulfuricystis multivorans]
MTPAMPSVLDLPPTSTATTPHFSTLPACREWIGRLPMANPSLVQKMLLDELRLLNGYTLTAPLRLELLETLQTPLHFVQEESASLFVGKSLPLAPIEQTALETSDALWQTALIGYLRCLEAVLHGDTAFLSRAALVCERALAILIADFADLTRGGWQADAPLWRFAHFLYSSAETLGVAHVPVTDPFRSEAGARPVSPAMVYAELALLATAGLHELPPRQQRWVMRWAHQWSAKLKVSADVPPLDAALPLCVDLAGEMPPGYLPHSGPGARWLETSALRLSMQKRIALLAKNDPEVTPASLGLGEDCTMPATLEVLQRVYPRWVKGGVQRRYMRHPLSGHCRFVAGVDAIHYYLSGRKPFRPPGSLPEETLRRQRETIAMLEGETVEFAEETSRELGFQTESWTVAEDWGLSDRSDGGLCLTRPIELDGGRLALDQLVAVQPVGSGHFLLGVVRWTQRRGNELVTGIQLMPGRAEPVAVRRTGVMATPDPYRPGFLLPAVSAVQQPLSLILPPGSYKAGRIFEVWRAHVTRRFRLDALLERGADFERAGCVELV